MIKCIRNKVKRVELDYKISNEKGTKQTKTNNLDYTENWNKYIK